MTQNNKMALASVIGIAMIWAFAWLPCESFAQADVGKPARLSVGTVITPPFATQTADGTWEGICIELWQAVAAVLDVQYEMRKYDTFEQLADAVEKRKVDVALALEILGPLKSKFYLLWNPGPNTHFQLCRVGGPGAVT